mgnify:CR=1 FL=1
MLSKDIQIFLNIRVRQRKQEENEAETQTEYAACENNETHSQIEWDINFKLPFFVVNVNK